jgi:hypothetical protein
MRNKAILDSGFLYATIDKGDVNHSRVVKVLTMLTDDILLPVTILVETNYLIHSRLGHSAMRRFVQQLEKSPLQFVSVTNGDIVRISELLSEYADLDLDFVDASIVSIAERLQIQRILTVDQRDFRIIRPKHCLYFNILP